VTPVVWRLEVHDALGSTSDPCIAAAHAGAPEGLAVLARIQTGGRGSRGRAWQSPAGNMYLSFLLQPAMRVTEAGIWPLLVSLAMHDAVRPLLPTGAALTLKWPNDLLLDGAKMAGILLDLGGGDGGRMEWLVVGCGVNLAVAPEVPGRRTASVAGVGGTVPDVTVFARDFLAAIDRRMTECAAEGIAAIHAAWLARAHPVGTVLAVTFGGQEVRGAFGGLSAEGHLVVETESGTRVLSTGEVLLAGR